MKYNSKTKRAHLKGLFIAGLLVASLGTFAQAQRTAVFADAQLGKIAITDMTGDVLDAENIQQEQLLKLTIPVSKSSHGKALPAGSCKIKIGFGSKLGLDPNFDLNTITANGFFKWSAVESGGQFQITGELVKALPADINTLDVAVRVKAITEGKSTITANFLVTNHNTAIVFSDEDGSNNASFLSYRVANKFNVISAIPEGNLKLSIYPNPAKDVSAVNIKLVQGKMNGKYNITMYDVTGKLIQTKELQMNFVSNFSYGFGKIAAGKYLIKVASKDAKESTILKFEKF